MRIAAGDYATAVAVDFTNVRLDATHASIHTHPIDACVDVFVDVWRWLSVAIVPRPKLTVIL